MGEPKSKVSETPLCACDGRGYYAVNNLVSACDTFEPTVKYKDVCYCGHFESCHAIPLAHPLKVEE
jgi:hypothetical protein